MSNRKHLAPVLWLCAVILSGCTSQTASPPAKSNPPPPATKTENVKPQDERARFFGKWEPQQLAADGGVVSVWEFKEDGTGIGIEMPTTGLAGLNFIKTKDGKIVGSPLPPTFRRRMQWSVKDDICSMDSQGIRYRYRFVFDAPDAMELHPIKDAVVDSLTEALSPITLTRFLKRLTKDREQQWNKQSPQELWDDSQERRKREQDEAKRQVAKPPVMYPPFK